jgi:hypothetical protein
MSDEERSVRRAAHFALVLALLYNGYLVLASWVVGSAQCVFVPLILILGLSRPFLRWLCCRGLGADWALLLTTIPALVWVGISNLCGDAIYWLKGPASIAWSSWPALLASTLAPYAALVAVGLLKPRMHGTA